MIEQKAKAFNENITENNVNDVLYKDNTKYEFVPINKRVAENLTGQKFGKWTVLGYLGNSRWLCQCECGSQPRPVRTDVLKSGKSLSCGCVSKRPMIQDLIGKRFGDLVVDSYGGYKNRRHYWNCTCNRCHTSNHIIREEDLIYGKTKTCGCTHNHIGDLTGKTFGDWTILNEVQGHAKKTWRCRCKCGTEKDVLQASLISGKSKSCGHCHEIHIGDRFGKLTVVEKASPLKDGSKRYKCKCSCGNPNLIIVRGSSLLNKNTESCGCITESKGESILKRFFMDNHVNIETQKQFDTCVYKRKLKFDFYLEDYHTAIEYDGQQHFDQYKGRYQDAEGFVRDNIKSEWCEENGIRLIRVPYTIYKDLNKYVMGELLRDIVEGKPMKTNMDCDIYKNFKGKFSVFDGTIKNKAP